MATEASDIKVEDQSNNNNDASSSIDSPKIKTEKQDEDQQVDQSNLGNNNTNDSALDSANGADSKMEDGADQDEAQEEDDDDIDDDEGGNNESVEMENDESMDDSEKTNLIVNYLPQQMTDDEFVALFTKFGEMKSCKIVRNRMTGCSYGFGFVDFETHEQALKAIDELNGHELDTKKMKVAFARPAGQDIKQANLYVKNIPLSWSQEDVKKAFDAYGNIIQVRVLGNNRGVAFVLYDLRKQAEMALEAMQGKKLEGADEPLEIKFAADKKSDKKRPSRRGGGGRSGNNNSGGDNQGGGGGGRTRERGNRGGVNRRNRPHSEMRNRSQNRGGSEQRGGNNRPNNNNYNNNNNSNNNNNGFGPIRQQPTNRMNRFAPFAPVHQQPQIQQATPMAAYGYPQQAVYPYMMQQQQQQQQQQAAPMMQFNPVAAAQPMAASLGPMGAYQMAVAAAAPQMAPIAYGAPAAQAMTNMYNIASNTMQNAAQMQPQLGQPMSNQARNTQSTGGGGGGGSNQANDGVTLFVYNIGPQSDESELRSMFAPYGQVLRCNVVRKTPGGETKGFGFVTLKDKNQANAAISSLNGSPRNGKTLQVSLKK